VSTIKTDGLQAKIGITTLVPKRIPEEGRVPPENSPSDNQPTVPVHPSPPPTPPPTPVQTPQAE